MGLTNIQVHNTVYFITERRKKLAPYLAGYYEQKFVDSQNFSEQIAKNTLDRALQKKIAKFYGTEINSFGRKRLEDYTHCLSKLDYDKKNSIAESKTDAFTCRNKESNKKLKESQRRH